METSTRKSGATLQDVALRVGVTAMTVSRALNGGQVSEAVRESVLKAVSELGYRPHLGARHMKSGKSRQVGVLVRNNSRANPEEKASHPLAYDLVLGISEGLEEAGYMMSFVRLSDVDPEKHIQSSAFQGSLLDGLIVVSDVPAADEARMEALMGEVVWLDGVVWKADNCVRRDETLAGDTVARELAALGYRKLIVLKHPDSNEHPHHYSQPERLTGLKSGANECGLEIELVDTAWIRPDYTDVVARLRPGTVVVASNSYIAHDLLFQLNEAGLSAGRDVPLACCDEGFRGAMIGWENLTRVCFDRFELGREAARMMMRRFERPDTPTPSLRLRGEWMAGTTAPQVSGA